MQTKRDNINFGVVFRYHVLSSVIIVLNPIHPRKIQQQPSELVAFQQDATLYHGVWRAIVLK